MHRAVLGRDGMVALLKATLMQLAGFEPDGVGPPAEEPHETVVEAVKARMLENAKRFDFISEKFR